MAEISNRPFPAISDLFCPIWPSARLLDLNSSKQPKRDGTTSRTRLQRGPATGQIFALEVWWGLLLVFGSVVVVTVAKTVGH